MKTRLSLSLSVLAVLAAACSPATVTEPPAQSAAPVVVVEASATSLIPVQATLEAVTQAPVAEVPSALPVATSRGPDLHATDPTTVSLVSGQYQFVEFFRFT